MAIIIPTLVRSVEELDAAISSNKAAIAVVNTSLFAAIKKEIRREDDLLKSQKLSKRALKGGIATVAGGFAVGIFGPLAAIPAAAVVTLAGLGAVAGGATVSFSNVLKKMKHYAWIESNNDRVLIILKLHGRNHFEKGKDTLDISRLDY